VFQIKVSAGILIETNENRNKRNDAAATGSWSCRSAIQRPSC